jgi:hypothetical protein
MKKIISENIGELVILVPCVLALFGIFTALVLDLFGISILPLI